MGGGGMGDMSTGMMGRERSRLWLGMSAGEIELSAHAMVIWN